MLIRLEKRPPRAVFMTDSGTKSGVPRLAPRLATARKVCGAPGLSTIKVAGAGGAGGAGALVVKAGPVQDPKYLLASSVRPASVKSPATARNALGGTKPCFHK